MRRWDAVPGVPAAGHVTAGGAWHTGRADGCHRCETHERWMAEQPRPHHEWVCSGHPEDDDPWCKRCGQPIDVGWGQPCRK